MNPGSIVFPSTYWPPHLPEMYDFNSGDIPSHIGSNHLGPYFYGPLKDDPTKPCPTFDLTSLEADSMCHSAQEAVWGTNTLERLESIKTAVDPKRMFNCFHCVGNKVVGDEAIIDEESSSSPDKDEAPVAADKDIVGGEESIGNEVSKVMGDEAMSDEESSSSPDEDESTVVADKSIGGGKESVGSEVSSSAAASGFELPMVIVAIFATILAF